jgi:hypothetical protein
VSGPDLAGALVGVLKLALVMLFVGVLLGGGLVLLMLWLS